MINFIDANALIDSPDNRHRRNEKATVMIGVTYPFKRYIWLERQPHGGIDVTLFGNHIATIVQEGWLIKSCGYFTPTTRLAFENLLPCYVTMKTPGSRGGSDDGPDTGFVLGQEIPSNEWLFLPEKVAVSA